MAYIWEDYSEANQYRVSSTGVSPYLETWEKGESLICVNIFLRLMDLLIPKKMQDCGQVEPLLSLYEQDARYQDFANILIHAVAQMDRYRGLTFHDVYSRHILDEISQGFYGAEIKEKVEKLSSGDQLLVGYYIAKYDLSSGREMQLDAALKALFQQVSIYYEQSRSLIHIVVGQEKTDYNQNLCEVLFYFFKDINTEVKIYWAGEQFGIIGVEETMRLDGIYLI